MLKSFSLRISNHLLTKLVCYKEENKSIQFTTKMFKFLLYNIIFHSAVVPYQWLNVFISCSLSNKYIKNE